MVRLMVRTAPHAITVPGDPRLPEFSGPDRRSNRGLPRARHMNVKPGSGFSIDHSSFTSTSGSQDCASCHSYPGTGTPSAANWYGASFDHTKNFTITAAD